MAASDLSYFFLFFPSSRTGRTFLLFRPNLHFISLTPPVLLRLSDPLLSLILPPLLSFVFFSVNLEFASCWSSRCRFRFCTRPLDTTRLRHRPPSLPPPTHLQLRHSPPLPLVACPPTHFGRPTPLLTHPHLLQEGVPSRPAPIVLISEQDLSGRFLSIFLRTPNRDSLPSAYRPPFRQTVESSRGFGCRPFCQEFPALSRTAGY